MWAGRLAGHTHVARRKNFSGCDLVNPSNDSPVTDLIYCSVRNDELYNARRLPLTCLSCTVLTETPHATMWAFFMLAVPG
jgi:hypothetical protein